MKSLFSTNYFALSPQIKKTEFKLDQNLKTPLLRKEYSKSNSNHNIVHHPKEEFNTKSLNSPQKDSEHTPNPIFPFTTSGIQSNRVLRTKTIIESSKIRENQANEKTKTLEEAQAQAYLQEYKNYSDLVKHILISKSKTQADMNILYEKLRFLPFFQKIEAQLTLLDDKEAFMYIIRHLKFEEVSNGTIIYREDEKTTGRAYILNSGSVSIFTKNVPKYEAYKRDIVDDKALKIAQRGTIPDESSEREETPSKQDPQNSQAIDTQHDQDSKPSTDSSPIKKRRGSLRVDTARNKMSDTELSSPSSNINSPLSTMTVGKLRRNNSNLRKLMAGANAINFVKVRRSSFRTETEDESQQSPKEKDPSNHIKSLKSAFFQRNTSMSSRDLKASKKNTLISKLEEKYGTLVEQKNIGDIFGEKALYTKQKRITTAVAMTPCELIYLTYEDLQAAKKMFDYRKVSLIDFMIGVIPHISTLPRQPLIHNLFAVISERTVSARNNVIQEGKQDDFFYVIYEGECEVYRNIELEKIDAKNKHDELPNCLLNQKIVKENIKLYTIQKGIIFGEEILFSEGKRYGYTIKVSSSEAKLIAVSRSKFKARFSKAVLAELKEFYERKQEKNYHILSQILALKGYDLDKEAFIEKNIIKTTISKKKLLERSLHSPLNSLSPRPQFHSPKINSKYNLSLTNLPSISIKTVEDIPTIHDQLVLDGRNSVNTLETLFSQPSNRASPVNLTSQKKLFSDKESTIETHRLGEKRSFMTGNKSPYVSETLPTYPDERTRNVRTSLDFDNNVLQLSPMDPNPTLSSSKSASPVKGSKQKLRYLIELDRKASLKPKKASVIRSQESSVAWKPSSQDEEYTTVKEQLFKQIQERHWNKDHNINLFNRFEFTDKAKLYHKRRLEILGSRLTKRNPILQGSQITLDAVVRRHLEEINSTIFMDDRDNENNLILQSRASPELENNGFCTLTGFNLTPVAQLKPVTPQKKVINIHVQKTSQGKQKIQFQRLKYRSDVVKSSELKSRNLDSNFSLPYKSSILGDTPQGSIVLFQGEQNRMHSLANT